MTLTSLNQTDLWYWLLNPINCTGYVIGSQNISDVIQMSSLNALDTAIFQISDNELDLFQSKLKRKL